jgi:hypothetical protein
MEVEGEEEREREIGRREKGSERERLRMEGEGERERETGRRVHGCSLSRKKQRSSLKIPENVSKVTRTERAEFSLHLNKSLVSNFKD